MIDTGGHYETCMRCNGKGSYRIRFGKPGFEPQVPGGYRTYSGTWIKTIQIDKCNVCLGSGKRKKRRKAPSKAVIKDTVEMINEETKRIQRMIIT